MPFKQLKIIICFLVFSASLSAQVPNTINYQGRLTDAGGSPVSDGAYLVKFTIYDAAVGSTELWNSGSQNVNIVDGLFDYQLGSMVMFPDNLFDDTSRYLGITVGIDAELAPRTRFNTVPFAKTIDGSDFIKKTGDNMTGILKALDASDTTRAEISGAGGGIKTFGTDGLIRSQLWSVVWGQILLYDNVSNLTVSLGAQSSLGGYLTLTDPIGAEDIYLNAGVTGNATVVFPNNAIDNTEIFDEPGISSNGSSAITTITNGSSTMQDIVTTTITIPNAGYIFTTSKCYVLFNGTTALNSIAIQIDETSGGMTETPHVLNVGHSSYHSSSSHRIPTALSRVFFKGSAGTYTFRLEASKVGTAGNSQVYQPTITAIYIPTSYGAVSTIADNPMGDPDAKLVSITDEDGNTHTGYKVDLRALELKAKDAALKLKQAELELLKARQQQQNIEHK